VCLFVLIIEKADLQVTWPELLTAVRRPLPRVSESLVKEVSTEVGSSAL